MVKNNLDNIEIYKESNSIIQIIYGIIITLFSSLVYLIFFKNTKSIVMMIIFGIFTITGMVMLIKGLINKNKALKIEANITKDTLELFMKNKKSIKYEDIKDIYPYEANKRILVIEYNKDDNKIKDLIYITGMNTEEFINEIKIRIKGGKT